MQAWEQITQMVNEGRVAVCVPGWEELFTDKILVVEPRLKNVWIHHFQHPGMCLLCMSSPMDFVGTACWLEMQLVCAQGSGSSPCSRAVPGSKTTWIELKGNCWKPLGKANYIILSLVCHVLFKVGNIFVSKWLHSWVCLSRFFF